MTPAQFAESQTKAAFAFRRALTPESDRGCALFAAAYLDRALSDLLFVSLVENKKVESDLFDGTAPLATFSSRIKLAYYLGKISPSIRRDLDLIRAIRNEFAHHPELILFTAEAIANRCKELKYSYHLRDSSPRDHFTSAVFGVLAQIHVETLRSVAPKELQDVLPTEAEKAAARERAKTIMPSPAAPIRPKS